MDGAEFLRQHSWNGWEKRFQAVGFFRYPSETVNSNLSFEGYWPETTNVGTLRTLSLGGSRREPA